MSDLALGGASLRQPLVDGASGRLRAICLALPEATEVAMRPGPSYRVADKIFANERSRSGRLSVWCKAPDGSQEVLIGADPRRFFFPPYYGLKGWVGMHLDDGPDWTEVAAFVKRSFWLVAPRRFGSLSAL
jgi:predicted DNA-binding protein (MmcQ/YjbR family)